METIVIQMFSLLVLEMILETAPLVSDFSSQSSLQEYPYDKSPLPPYIFINTYILHIHVYSNYIYVIYVYK